MKLTVMSLALIILYSGCSPKYYTPNTQNVPMLSKKNQANISVVPLSGRVEVMGSYALTEDVAVQLNGGRFSENTNDTTNGGSGTFLEVGSGYYYKFAKHGLCDIYALAGYGTMENHFPSSVDTHPGTTGKISAEMLRGGVQSSVGFTSEYFDAFASVRLASLYYSNISGSFVFDSTNQVTYLTNNSVLFLAEPAITVRGGYAGFKMQLQLGRSFNLTLPDFRQDKSWFTVGFGYTFQL